MGLFGKKDLFYEKYGDVDLTKDEDALVSVWAEGLTTGSDGLKALFIIKSFIGMDTNTYKNCIGGFEKQKFDFWDEWLQVMGLGGFRESCDRDNMNPFFYFLLHDYKCQILKKNVSYGSYIDFSNGKIYDPNNLKGVYNFSEQALWLTEEFVDNTVLYTKFGKYNYENEIMQYALLENDMIKNGLDEDTRKNILFTNYSFTPLDIAKRKYNDCLQNMPKSTPMDLNKFRSENPED